jgi:hypothetical protein
MRHAWILAALGLPGALAGQDSQFSLGSPGTPARQESVRARAAAGAFALFDALSPLGEAALADVTRGVFSAQGRAVRRAVDFGGAGSHTVRESRFPVLVAAGRTPWGFAVATGFATYLDRSFVVQRRDSIVLRGGFEPYTDEHVSDGSVADLRVAVAGRPIDAVAIGGAFHVLVGSTQEEVRRRWDDSVTYRNTFELRDVRYRGLGASLSAVVTVTPRVRVAGWMRTDNALDTEVGDRRTGSADLPTQLGGAVEWRARGSLRLAGTVRWAGWAGPPGGHDALGWSVGAEAGNPALPVRLGVRRETMAFGPGTDAPTELGITAGVGTRFSEDRARIDLAFERVLRSGPGLDERLWTLHVGLSVLP